MYSRLLRILSIHPNNTRQLPSANSKSMSECLNFPALLTETFNRLKALIRLLSCRTSYSLLCSLKYRLRRKERVQMGEGRRHIARIHIIDSTENQPNYFIVGLLQILRREDMKRGDRTKRNEYIDSDDL